jgi:hypothetical protein
LHRLTGAYDQAETLALRARAIRREVLVQSQNTVRAAGVGCVE